MEETCCSILRELLVLMILNFIALQFKKNVFLFYDKGLQLLNGSFYFMLYLN